MIMRTLHAGFRRRFVLLAATVAAATACSDDDNRAAPANQAPQFTSAPDVRFSENTPIAFAVEAVDPDGDAVTLSLSAAGDGAFFTLDLATGVVTSARPFDFETPQDADSDNTYALAATASDGAATTTQMITVAITDVVDPFNTRGAVAIFGAEAGDAARVVDVVGDLDEDGVADLVIGAAGATPEDALNAGVVYVVLGAALLTDADGVFDLAAFDQLSGVRVFGEGASVAAGADVAGVGDLDGDGAPEVAASSPLSAETPPEAGVTVVFGSALRAALNADGVIRFATLVDDGLGVGLDVAPPLLAATIDAPGDVDGDGVTDVLVCASAPDVASNAAVVFGDAVVTARGQGGRIDLADVGLTGEGVALGGCGDTAFATRLGDIDGDGRADVLTGAFNRNNAFPVFVHAGAAIAAARGAGGVAAPAITFEPDADGSGLTAFPDASAPVGDVNGDGFDDIMISIVNPQTPLVDGYLVFGSPTVVDDTGGVVVVAEIADSGLGVRFERTAVSDTGIGRAAAAAGDVDGDGVDDFFFGPDLIFGGDLGGLAVIPETAIGDTVRAVRITGATPATRALSRPFDLGGDGFDDVVLRADDDSPLGRPGAGVLLLVSGALLTAEADGDGAFAVDEALSD